MHPKGPLPRGCEWGTGQAWHGAPGGAGGMLTRKKVAGGAGDVRPLGLAPGQMREPQAWGSQGR